MGSSFSVVNDTGRKVWVQQRTQWKVVIGVVAGLGATAIGVTSILSVIAGGAVVAAGALEGAAVLEGVGTTLGLGTGGWNVTGTVFALVAEALGIALAIPHKNAKRMLGNIKKFKKASVELNPGEKFTFYGSLSLVRRVAAMNDRFQLHARNCWTGPTHRSNNTYTISEHFSNLVQEIAADVE